MPNPRRSVNFVTALAAISLTSLSGLTSILSPAYADVNIRQGAGTTSAAPLHTRVDGGSAATDPGLTLAEAEALWSRHSREVRMARLAVEAAQADRLTADRAPNPNLSFNVASISPNEGLGGGKLRDKRMDSILRLEQLVERGDKQALRARLADAQVDAARHDVDDVLRQQRLALVGAYYDLVLAQERVGVAGFFRDLAKKTVDLSEIRLKAGDIGAVELSRLQVEMARAEGDVAAARSDLTRARSALAYLLGKEREVAGLRVVAEWPGVDGATPDNGAALDNTLEGALGQRADVAAARARVEAAEHARDLARAQLTRDVTVGVQLEHNLQNAPSNSFGLGVSVPLFLRHQYEGEIRRAEADLDIAREDLGRIEAQARTDLAGLRGDLAAVASRRRELEQRALPDARKVAEAAEFAYGRGGLSLLDLFDARRTWRQVQLDLAQARSDHARASLAWSQALHPPVPSDANGGAKPIDSVRGVPEGAPRSSLDNH